MELGYLTKHIQHKYMHVSVSNKYMHVSVSKNTKEIFTMDMISLDHSEKFGCNSSHLSLL